MLYGNEVSARRDAIPFTIVAGQSLSGPLSLGAMTAVRVEILSGLPDLTTLTFQSSYDGEDFNDLCDEYGEEYVIAEGKVAQDHSYLLPMADFASIEFLKVRLGTIEAPRVSGQDVQLVLIVVA